MEINELIKELQELIDEKYPKLKIHLAIDYGQLVIVGMFNIMRTHFAFDVCEFEQDDISKETLIKSRILDGLYSLIDVVEKDIKEIENAKTKRT